MYRAFRRTGSRAFACAKICLFCGFVLVLVVISHLIILYFVTSLYQIYLSQPYPRQRLLCLGLSSCMSRRAYFFRHNPGDRTSEQSSTPSSRAPSSSSATPSRRDSRRERTISGHPASSSFPSSPPRAPALGSPDSLAAIGNLPPSANTRRSPRLLAQYQSAKDDIDLGAPLRSIRKRTLSPSSVESIKKPRSASLSFDKASPYYPRRRPRAVEFIEPKSSASTAEQKRRKVPPLTNFLALPLIKPSLPAYTRRFLSFGIKAGGGIVHDGVPGFRVRVTSGLSGHILVLMITKSL